MRDKQKLAKVLRWITGVVVLSLGASFGFGGVSKLWGFVVFMIGIWITPAVGIFSGRRK